MSSSRRPRQIPPQSPRYTDSTREHRPPDTPTRPALSCHAPRRAAPGRCGYDDDWSPRRKPLAGLSLASTILTTLVGVCIFLSYATTAATARFVGAGKPGLGLRQGLDGMWLAVGLGVVLGIFLAAGAKFVLGWFGPEADVLDQAASYAQASAFGLPGMLLVLAATGTLRGFADTRTP